MRILSVVNQKGGCGKTTVSINLAAALAKRKKDVLLIDMDPQGHAPIGLNIDPEDYERSTYDVLMHAEVEIDGAMEQEAEALPGDSAGTAPVPLVTAAPPTVDYRNANGVSFVSPVKNQGACGSCLAFAVTAALESQVMIATSGAPIDLSEQILVSCSGAGSCSGGSPTTSSNYIRDVGLPLDSCFRYTATNNSCINACLNWQNDTYRVIGWHRAGSTGNTVDDIKNSLYAYGPVVATMYVYNDFFSYLSGIYSYTSGAYAGAHAVLVVGYDDANQSFIVKNSWVQAGEKPGSLILPIPR